LASMSSVFLKELYRWSSKFLGFKRNSFEFRFFGNE